MPQERPVVLVQLPFPSQTEPEAALQSYYAIYSRLFDRLVPDYGTTQGDLWEAPLWVAHLDGALGREDTTFVDLSLCAADSEVCSAELRQRVRSPAYVLFSPLAQNFDLAVRTAHRLRGNGLITVLGGNMARLATQGDFDLVFAGHAGPDLYERLECREHGLIGVWPKPGTRQLLRGGRPRYRLLASFGARVPLIRLNASHGCLFGCTFCGDCWSRQLHVVPYDDLQDEFDEIEATFPGITTVYVGDKTFGQSREAVENLIRATARRHRPYQFIVQTHVSMVDDWLFDALDRLGAGIVELGFETADERVLKELRKRGGVQTYRAAIERLHRHGRAVILNVMGGLPSQTEETQTTTVQFLRETAPLVYLYNLYNFVPYPETPLFSVLRPRIVDWDFSHWREDQPVIFRPDSMTRERAWALFMELVQECTDLCQRRERSLFLQDGTLHA